MECIHVIYWKTATLLGSRITNQPGYAIHWMCIRLHRKLRGKQDIEFTPFFYQASLYTCHKHETWAPAKEV